MRGRRAVSSRSAARLRRFDSALPHEIGHILRPRLPQIHRAQIERLDSSTTARRCCDCELVSWQWAASVARPAWTPETHAEASRSIQTYVRRTRTPARRPGSIPGLPPSPVGRTRTPLVSRGCDKPVPRLAHSRAPAGLSPQIQTLHGDAPLCINHQLDRQIADQRRRVAAMKPRSRSV